MTTIQPGDVVEIRPPSHGLVAWHGLRCSVKGVDGYNAWLQPLSVRPDGCGTLPLYWPVGDLLLLLAAATPEPATTPKLDERYQASAHWADGRVVTTRIEWSSAESARRALAGLAEAQLNADLGSARVTVMRRYVSEWEVVAES